MVDLVLMFLAILMLVSLFSYVVGHHSGFLLGWDASREALTPFSRITLDGESYRLRKET